MRSATRGRLAALILFLPLLAGCDQRPTLRLAADSGAPAAPADAAFQQLPSHREVLAAAEAHYRYWQGLRIELPRLPVGEVRWERDDDTPAHYWTFQPPLRVYGALGDAVRYPDAVRKLSAPLRWQFRSGAWQLDNLFSGYHTRYRGLPEPSPEQLLALLRQPGINYLRHRIAAVPEEIQLDGEPRWPRDEEGFALLRSAVEFTATAPLFDEPAGMLQQHELRLRAQVRLDMESERWWIEEDVEVLASRFRFSKPTSAEQLSRMRTEMGRFWRGGR
jgi:hypothetical protein